MPCAPQRRNRLIAFVATGFLFTGCSYYSEDEYLAKVKETQEYEQQVVSQEEQIQKLENSIESLQQELANVRSTSRAENEELRQQLNNSDGTFQKRSASLRSQVTDVEAKLADSEATNEKLNGVINSYERKIQNLEAQNEEQVAQTEELEDYRRELEESILELEDEIQQLSQSIGIAEQENADLTEQKDAMYSLVKDYQKDLETTKTQSDKAREQQQDFITSLRSQLESDQVKIEELENRVAVRLDERLLFDSGKSHIKASGFKVLDKIGAVLKKISDKHIQVEGHTDNVKIGPSLRRRYPTNWELSVARATSVARYLIDAVKISPERISSAGYGQFQPIADNKTPEGRQANRRVEFALVPVRTN